jgi:hypothetical protein
VGPVQVLKALAQPADVQLTLYPDFVVKADELALDFNNFYEACLPEMSDEQAAASSHIERRLIELSGPAGPWSEDDLRHAREWADIRDLAKQALEVFGWPDEPPPPSPDVVVRFPE